MVDALTTYKGQELVGITALVDAAAEVLREMGSRQQRKTVSELPNERTVRYYISEGLLPGKDDIRDRTPVYGYRHLLLLIVIKLLQSQDMTISVIRSLIEGKSEEELEQFVYDRSTTAGIFAVARSRERRESPRDRALEYLESLHFGDEMKRRPIRFRMEERWHRYVIEEGLEIHIREGFRVSRHPQLRRAVNDAIAEVLDRLP